MDSQLLMYVVTLFLLFITLVTVLLYGANSKKKGNKIFGQLLPVLTTALIVAGIFFASGGFGMKPVEWVEFGGIFAAPAVLMCLFTMGSIGILGMIQSKRQQSPSLFVVSLLNVLALPAVAYTAWHLFG